MSRFESRQKLLPPVQSLDIINPLREFTTPNQEGNTLIWLDKSLNSMNEDISKTKQVLRSVNDYVLLFDDGEKCFEYIKSIDTDNIFLIIPGRSSNELLSLLHNLNQVKAICIFCINENDHKSLRKDYKKVIDICTEQEHLVKCLQKTIHSFIHNASLIGLLNDKSRQRTYLSATDAYNCKKQQIIRNVILRMPRTEKCKQKLVDYCRLYYQGNQSVLKKIDEFDEHYESPHHAIYWYTTDSFLFRMINNAFRTRNIELLEIFHYFIVDLSKSLEYDAEQLRQKFTSCDQSVLSLYRGHHFSREEYERFISSCGYIVFNSYLSTSTNIEIAKLFAGSNDNKITEDPDFIRVLFHIEIDFKSLNNSDVILADISNHSNFKEEAEYLFDVGTTFEVINVNRQYKTIQLIVSDKAHHLSLTQMNDAYIRKYASEKIINITPDDFPYPPPNDYAGFLLSVDQTFGGLDAFEAYILKTSIDNENYQTGSKYCIEGHTLCREDHHFFIRYSILDADLSFRDEYTDAYNQAMKYFQAFHDCASGDSIQCALRALGFTYYRIDNYEQSLKYFIEASKMSDAPLDLATCFHFLGCIHGKLSNNAKSMNYFDKVLQMRDNIKSSFMAASYRQMAMFAERNEEKEYLSKALNIYQQINEELSVLKCRSKLFSLSDWAPTRDDCIEVLDLYFKYCQDHQIRSVDVAELYRTIGNEYIDYLDYDRALECYFKTIVFFPNSASDHKIISDIYIRKSDSKSSIEYLEKTLKITENSKQIFDCYLLLGIEHSKENNLNKALKCFEQSVSICEQLNSDAEFNDYIFDLELRRKSQITTCKSFSDSPHQAVRILYFYNKALYLSLDFPKLFQSEIMILFELIDLVLKSNHSEQLRRLSAEINNNDETRIKKFILETIFDIYIIMADSDVTDCLFYYLKALEIFYNGGKITIDRNVETMVTSKIIHIAKLEDAYNQLMKEFHERPRLPDCELGTIETQEERDVFKSNYFLELKRNQLTKIYAYIGDVHLKAGTNEQALLYYDKSIEYYETFSSLYHLELADLYSKKAYIICNPLGQQITTDDNIMLKMTALTLFEKSVEAIKHEGEV